MATATERAESSAQGPLGRFSINAETVEMVAAEGVVVFEKSVVAEDSSIRLTANRLEVHLTETNTPKYVEATGDVVILELGTDRKATAGKAVYDVAKDEIVLSENPVLAQGQGGISGAEKIVYSRGDGRFRFVGGTKGLAVRYSAPQGSQGGMGLFGQAKPEGDGN